MNRILTTIAAALLASGAQAQVLGFGSAPQGSIGYNMSSAIARVMSETAQIQSRVQPYSGSSAVLPLVNTGELDLAVCNVLEIEEATRGEGPYKGRKQANLRVLGVIFPLYSSIFVRKDSPIRTLSELKGKRLPYGYSAQVTLERIVDAIIASGGLTRKDIVPVLVPNVVRGADDFTEGKIDGGFFALGAGRLDLEHALFVRRAPTVRRRLGRQGCFGVPVALARRLPPLDQLLFLLPPCSSLVHNPLFSFFSANSTKKSPEARALMPPMPL